MTSMIRDDSPVTLVGWVLEGTLEDCDRNDWPDLLNHTHLSELGPLIQDVLYISPTVNLTCVPR